MSRTSGKVATWLEVATAAHARDKHVSVRVHPLTQAAGEVPSKRRDKAYYGITVDGRWLHSNNGRLTVLRGLKAVERFADLIKAPAYEPGEPVQIDVDCGKTSHCITVGKNRALQG
ncbi:MAG TPA: hypothetical protein PLO71_03860 [Thauera phenylacetica]|nr:hypothetical protein [Thauera phenylacetica]